MKHIPISNACSGKRVYLSPEIIGQNNAIYIRINIFMLSLAMYNNIKIIFHIQIIHVFQEMFYIYIAYCILHCTVISISCTYKL